MGHIVPPLMPIKPPVWSWENSQERRLRELADLQRLRLQMKPLLQDGSPAALAQASQLAKAPETAKAAAAYKQQLLNGLKAHLGGPQAQPVPALVSKPKKKGRLSALKGAVGDVFDAAGDALGTAGGAVLSALNAPQEYFGAPLAGGLLEGGPVNMAKRAFDPRERLSAAWRLKNPLAAIPGLGLLTEEGLDTTLGGVSKLAGFDNGLSREYDEARNRYNTWEANAPVGVSTAANILTDPTMYVGPGAVGKLAKLPQVASRLPGPVATALTASRSPIGGLLEGVTPQALPGLAIGAGLGAEAAERYDVPFTPEWVERTAAPLIAGGLLAGRTAGRKMEAPKAEIAFGKGPAKTAVEEAATNPPAVRRVIPNSTVVDEPTPARLGLAVGEERAISDQLTLRRRNDGGFELEDPNGTIAVEPDEDLSWAFSAGSPLGAGKGQGAHRPLANERLWFHSTRDLDYDVPDPDMSVGTATAITQGPGVYLAADPERSAGRYGNRTFITEFDGNVLDLTKLSDGYADDVNWADIYQRTAERMAQYLPEEAANNIAELALDIERGDLRFLQDVFPHADMAKHERDAWSSYHFRDALAKAITEVADDIPAEAMGRFAGAAGRGMEDGALAVISDVLADSGVDALFHVSPNADGEVLIVLNGDKARVLGDARNAEVALSQGKTWDEIRSGIGSEDVAESVDKVRPGFWKVSAGSTVLGYVEELPWGKWQASAPDGVHWGEFPTRDEALDAVRERMNARPSLQAFDDEAGAMNTGLASTLGAGAVGGLIGYGTGDTPEERARNAAIGAGLGLGVGAAAVGLARKVKLAEEVPTSDVLTEAKQAVSQAEAATPAASRAVPSAVLDGPFALPKIEPGLTRRDGLVNLIKRTIGIGTEEEAFASPAMRARQTAKYEAKSQAARLQAITGDLLQVFRRDQKGRILDLPGQPTVRDLAAAYPQYEMLLTPEQRAAMEQLRAEVEPYRKLLEDAGVTIEGSRDDVTRGGGFYLPRGRTALEGAEAPVREPSPTMRVGGKKGFEKEAKFATEAQGIEAGFEYADVDEALYHYAVDAGNRAIDSWTAQYFKSLRDELGETMGKTPLDRVSPELRSKYESAQRKLASVRARLQTAERRAGIYADQSDELDAVLDSLREAAPQEAVRGAARTGTAVRRLERQADRLRSERMGRPPGAEPVRISLPPTEANLTKAATLQKAIDTLREVIPDDVERLRAMDTALERTKRRIEVLRKRSGAAAGEAASLQQQLAAAEKRLTATRAQYKRALESGRRSGLESGQIRIAPLSGRQFPVAMANAANKYINAESKPIGRGAILLEGAEAFNQFFRGLRASADVSFMGIQGLLGAVHDPKGYASALRLAWQAMGDPHALGAYMREFDVSRPALGRATSQQWAAAGLHLNGADTEFSIAARGLGRLGQKVGAAPVIKQSNRMFGYFGDTLRLEMADSMLETAMASGRAMDEQTMREIAMAADLMTGWSPQTMGGSVAQLTQFAPRFFSSQLQLIQKAVTDNSITGQQARRAFAKLAGAAVILTAAGNAASDDGLSPEEYLQPLKNGRFNPNFMRIRFGGQDSTLLGPWDSLVRGVVSTATGDPAYFLRTKASPAVGTLWDLFSGETMVGDDARSWEYVARSFLPFSIADIGRESPTGTAIAATGLKASPMSNSERLDEVSRRMFGQGYWDLEPAQRQQVKDEHPDTWARYVEEGQSTQRKRAEELRADFDQKQQARDDAFLSGTMQRDEWVTAYRAGRDELNARLKEVYGDTPMTEDKIKTPLDAWRFQVEQATDPTTGVVNWDLVDNWLGSQSAKDQEYIERNSGVSATPLVKLYRKMTSEYYDIPRYRGYTASQGSQVDQLVAAARSAARTDSPAAYLSALKRITQQIGGVDEAAIKGARRVLLGIMRPTQERQKWRKANPASALFLGAGPLTPEEQQAVNTAMAPFARRAA